MKPLLLLLALSTVASAAPANRPARRAPAKPAVLRASVPVVTRDNFVSLSLVTMGGFAGRRTEIKVQNNSISRESGRPSSGGASGTHSYVAPTPVPLSNNQLGLLLRAINEAKLPSLVGKYEDKYLRDGFNQTVVLTISDKQNRDQTFTIESYGDKAPRAYYTFLTRLNEFATLKIPQSKSTAPAR